jgi:Ca2+-binding EF-hand superfamily protein
MHTRSAKLIVLAILAAGAQARSADPARGCVDPYNPGDERSRFLFAAGVDNELSAEEFQADQAKGNNFARKFDNWQVMLKYDRNKNTRISWLEADAYRLALAKEALAAFDADGNRRLAGEERKKLIALLSAGKLPGKFGQVEKDKPAAGAGNRAGPAADETGRARSREEFTRKYDTDGDGRLSREERRKAFEDVRRRREQQQLETYDTDGDGQLSEAERQAQRDDRRKRFRERIRRMLTRKHDANKDGVLDETESANMQAEMERMEQRIQRAREARARRQRERVERFDADGDGELSDQERQTMRETIRAEARKAWETFSSRADADGDGKTSRRERRDYFRNLVETYDADDSGRLDEEEWRKLVETEGYDPRRMRPSRRRRRGRGRNQNQ